jgi:hypothetical protein
MAFQPSKLSALSIRFPCITPGADDALLCEPFCDLTPLSDSIERCDLLEHRHGNRPLIDFLAEIVQRHN